MGGTNEVSEQLRKGPRSYESKNNTHSELNVLHVVLSPMVSNTPDMKGLLL
jgi:hypothetical protein